MIADRLLVRQESERELETETETKTEKRTERERERGREKEICEENELKASIIAISQLVCQSLTQLVEVKALPHSFTFGIRIHIHNHGNICTCGYL